MLNKNSTTIFPEWVKELSPTPEKYIRDFFKNLAFLKMKELEREMEVYEKKYRISFEEFEKKLKKKKKENFKSWDDYLVWKGIYLARQKWFKRYKEI